MKEEKTTYQVCIQNGDFLSLESEYIIVFSSKSLNKCIKYIRGKNVENYILLEKVKRTSIDIAEISSVELEDKIEKV